jgi:magnesium-protoporphyrin O-methyltransferase
MTTPHCCQLIDDHFSEQKAADQAKELDRTGPPEETRLLIRALEAAGVQGLQVLDVGAGLGVITERLLQAGAHSAILIDISRGYLNAAASRLEAAGFRARAELVHGDITGLPSDAGKTDVVTLDKVICCYPDMRKLVQLSASKAGRFWAATYPRERWLVRLMFWFENTMRKLRGNRFRTFIHPIRAIESELEAHGFVLRSAEHTGLWRVVLFERRQARPA